MVSEFFDLLSDWRIWDTWIVITAALAAMACAIPGCFLLLRRQSLMGDALSHTTLLGVVAAFLFAQWLQARGVITPEGYAATQHALMFGGAMIVGVVSALLTEWIQKLGRVEASAALGVVFTTFFAVGLLLIRVAADSAHIDPNCVFYGTIETSAFSKDWRWPAPAISNGVMLVANLGLLLLFYKELKISTFDPALATTLGINARAMHFGLMAISAATLVAAFESVGNVLVIALLIVPAATASLLTDRLGWMIVLSLVVAAASAALGHVFAITLPAIIFPRLGFDTVRDASTAGMMAGTCGMFFLLAVVFGPRSGLLSRIVDRSRIAVRVAADDLLGLLYRLEEAHLTNQSKQAPQIVAQQLGIGRLLSRLALSSLNRSGRIVTDDAGYHLTDSGREVARKLVRSHRLWEAFMAKHFQLPPDHLHESAARVEHYLNPEIRAELEADLETPDADPHGREIPGEDRAST